jgi:hypothetical protein
VARVVEVVDRLVEVEVRVPQVEQVEVTVEVMPRGGPGWLPVLGELVRQVETGRIYDRDLPALGEALQEVINALQRRRDNQARFRR